MSSPFEPPINPFTVDVRIELNSHFPSDIADIIFNITDYDYVEWKAYYRQLELNEEIKAGLQLRHVETMTNTKQKLNFDIVRRSPYIQEFWSDGLLNPSVEYCHACGQHKSSRCDGGVFQIGCRGYDGSGWGNHRPRCREVKYTVCDCHDCDECKWRICRGQHRQCDECDGTFVMPR